MKRIGCYIPWGPASGGSGSIDGAGGPPQGALEFAMVTSQPIPATVAPSPGMLDDQVATLPPPGSPERWPWLQRLRRQPRLALEPWLRALERGSLAPHLDLMAVLADRLDGPAMARLLRWWSASEPWDPALPALLVPRRDRHGLEALRQAVAIADQERLVALLPLLGHQRDPEDAPLLCQLALEPGPLRLRQAALEGLCRGLGAWPRPALRRTLLLLARDLHPPLAATAVDALARLPEARPFLFHLARQPLDPAVAERLTRRMRRQTAAPLVLLVHGRAAGRVPPELMALAAHLQERRGAPVILETLTAPEPPPIPLPPAPQTTLVPLFLLPGGHVRRDLPARLRRWREAGPTRVLPFLGAWPAWQAILAAEARHLAGQGEAGPRLLHHPVDGSLPQRYLTHLASRCGASCQPLPLPDAGDKPVPPRALEAALPLVLAASRLSEGLPGALAIPLLGRPRVREGLIQLLEELP
ncbi:MAG: CbiX/SirB N-terminal domain-containing protein [Cyanobacteriota bacterium]|nr:CbiX/SirB N-terminal domain-containing protein [Cyanobacteriota bacterium]